MSILLLSIRQESCGRVLIAVISTQKPTQKSRMARRGTDQDGIAKSLQKLWQRIARGAFLLLSDNIVDRDIFPEQEYPDEEDQS